MEDRDMIRMANQIAAFFEAYPRPEALDGIAKHIKGFWDPRMRKRIDDYIEGGGEGLSPLVISALAPKSKSKAKAKS
jgi:formate dehydrogenase subunit delta